VHLPRRVFARFPASHGKRSVATEQHAGAEERDWGAGVAGNLSGLGLDSEMGMRDAFSIREALRQLEGEA
jgi:hypothetical protein